MIIFWVLAIIALYLVVVFVIPLLFFPNYLIFQTKIKFTKKINQISSKLKSPNKEKTLKNIFNFVAKSYSSEKPFLFILLQKHFYHNVDSLITNKQFLPCHVQSLVFRALLLATKQFSDKNLEKKIVMTPFGVIHQYYLVKVKDRVYKADLFFEILEAVK